MFPKLYKMLIEKFEENVKKVPLMERGMGQKAKKQIGKSSKKQKSKSAKKQIGKKAKKWYFLLFLLLKPLVSWYQHLPLFPAS